MSHNASKEPVASAAIGVFREAESMLRYAGDEATADTLAEMASWLTGWQGPEDRTTVQRIAAECTAAKLARLEATLPIVAAAGLTEEHAILDMFLDTFRIIVATTVMVAQARRLGALATLAARAAEAVSQRPGAGGPR